MVTAGVRLLPGELRRGVAWLVELEARDVLKVLKIAREQGQVMLQSSGRNKNIHIAELPPDRPGKSAPHDGKAFHDRKGEGEDLFSASITASATLGHAA